jgi:hypothetical protein
MGLFERVPKVNTDHTGSILKTAGQLYWQNNAGGKWSLMPNIPNERFDLNADSPTPDEKFRLELVETDCALHALGFNYLNHYYWKPKRNTSNASPILVNGIADLTLPKDFGTHNINLADVFKDPEGDSLLLFVTSEDSSFISAKINANQLSLKGGKVGSTTIYLMGLDANGGLAVNKFDIQVKSAVSTDDLETNVAVFPSLTQDFIHVVGAGIGYDISLISIDKSYQQNIPVTGESMRIDLSYLSTGMYFLLIKNPKTGITKVEKIIRY